MNRWRRTLAILAVIAMSASTSSSLTSVTSAYAENDAKTGSAMDFSKKTPLEYTLEEYGQLTPQQQDEFFLWFESIEAFESWMVDAALPMPWESENRNPAEYTWDEYCALTYEQQAAFIAAFETVDAFEEWMESAQDEDAVVLPWMQEGKMPDEYTWEEYEALTLYQKNAFVEWFGNESNFEAWMEMVREQVVDAEVMPWKDSEKKPVDYTWDEFEALTVGQQKAFIEWFGSTESFEMWMEAAKRTENTELVIPWANDKKQPDAYTAEEFEGLTPYQQSMFFIWFESAHTFDQWLDTAFMGNGETLMTGNAQENTIEPQKQFENISYEEKLTEIEIEAYTWSEYEQMTSEERIIFFKRFISADRFSMWVETLRPDDLSDELMPWDNTQKQPVDYAWEEYEALPVELQDAFFAWFETAELFEEWVQSAAGPDVLSSFGISDSNDAPLANTQVGEETEDPYPCAGRTIKSNVNIRTDYSTQSAVAGMVYETGTEVKVVGIVMDDDASWYLINFDGIEGYIRSDLLELVIVEQ